MVDDNYTQRKAQQLGMSFSTARSQLVKILMFEMLKRLDENICFKCRKIIDNIEELSIEHKQPWVDIDPQLFWDLDNIAFSHNKCNRPDRPYKVYENEKARNRALYNRIKNDPVRYNKRLQNNRNWYSKIPKDSEKYSQYLERKKNNQRRYDNVEEKNAS
jgi:hypothetical protein